MTNEAIQIKVMFLDLQASEPSVVAGGLRSLGFDSQYILQLQSSPIGLAPDNPATNGVDTSTAFLQLSSHCIGFENS